MPASLVGRCGLHMLCVVLWLLMPASLVGRLARLAETSYDMGFLVVIDACVLGVSPREASCMICCIVLHVL